MSTKPINGPYEFGDQPPRHLMGWIPKEPHGADPFAAAIRKDAPHAYLGKKKTFVPIWDVVKQHNNGQHLPTLKQQIGDCVGVGLAQAGQYLAVTQISSEYQEEIYHPWHGSYIYGISRVQIGGGSIPGEGSRGAWGAAAVQRYGVLFTDDTGIPPYSGSISTAWGESPGPPASAIAIASDNNVIDIRKLSTVDQIREALLERRMVTIASMRGFMMKPYNKDGFHVFRPQGSWPHQMCLLAWMDQPFQAAYRINSWGSAAHGTPLHGEPPGGAWNLATDLEAELRDPRVEIYAYDLFDGDPDSPNHELIWLPKNLRNITRRHKNAA